MDTITAGTEAVGITGGEVAMVAGAAGMGAIHGTDGDSAWGGHIGGGTPMPMTTVPGRMIPTHMVTPIAALPATLALTMATMILHRQIRVEGQT